MAIAYKKMKTLTRPDGSNAIQYEITDSAGRKMIAPKWYEHEDDAFTAGQHIEKDGVLYRFLVPHTAESAWNSNEVTAVDVGEEIEAIVTALNQKANKVSGAVNGNFAALDAGGNLTDSGKKPSDFITEHQDISGKADKVVNGASGNFVSLDANGNIQDSGSKASDFLTQHQDISGKADKTDTVLNTTLSRGRKANTTVGEASYAFGDDVEASGDYSHAEGSGSISRAEAAHAEGSGGMAAGAYSHVEGLFTGTCSEASHAEGTNTLATRKSQHVFGENNVWEYTEGYQYTPMDDPAIHDKGKFIEIVGNGDKNESEYSNARTLDWDGNERLAGDLYVHAEEDGTGGDKVATEAAVQEVSTELKSAFGEEIDSAYVTTGIDNTNNGVTRQTSSDKLKLYGTASASRNICFLNGQNAQKITSSAFDMTLEAGTYLIETEATGYQSEYTIRGTYSTFSNAFSIVTNITPSKQITFTAPVMIGFLIYDNRNYGTSENPTLFSFRAKRLTAKDIVARAKIEELSEEIKSNIPDYYFENDYLRDKVTDINMIGVGVGANSLRSIFITDYHYEDNARKSPALIKYLMQNTGIKSVIFGGDAFNYDYDSKVGGYNKLCAFMKDFQPICEAGNMYLVTGNHEMNNADQSHDSVELSREVAYNLFNEPIFYKIHALRVEGQNTNSFYVDDDVAMIRFYGIDCSAGGTIRKTNLDVILPSLLTVPAGYSVVVFSHTGVDSYTTDTSVEPPIYTITALTTTFEAIMAAGKAMNDGSNATITAEIGGTTYSWNIDFTGKARTFVGAIIGHSHRDSYYIYDSRFPVILVNCDTGAYRDTQPYRIAGTITEQAFDVIQIDISTKHIYCTRIGFGEDREFTFGDGAGLVTE